MSGVPYAENDQGIIQAIMDLRTALINAVNPGSGNMFFNQNGNALDAAIITDFYTPLLVSVSSGTAEVRHAVSGVTPGTYTKFTVDAYGHVTQGTTLIVDDLPVHTHTVGQVEGFAGAVRDSFSGQSPIDVNAGTGVISHLTSGVSAGTYTKVTVNTTGHITSATTLSAGDLPQASTTAIGGIEIATQGEVNTGTATNLAVTPATLAVYVPTVVPGAVPYATQPEVNAGTVNNKAINPLTLATYFGVRTATESVTGTTRVATQAETNAGILDTVHITPLKLKTLNDNLIANISTTNPGLIATASNSDMTTGTATNKAVTPASLTNLIGTTYLQATETLRGTLEVATQTETNDGLLDTVAVTPLKYRTSFLGWQATTAVRGTIQLATNGEVTTGTDPNKAVTPASLSNLIGTKLNPATETNAGVLEIATQTETDTGTADGVAVTPLKLASYFNTKNATTSVNGTGRLATNPEALAGALTGAVFMNPARTKEAIDAAFGSVIPLVVALG